MGPAQPNADRGGVPVASRKLFELGEVHEQVSQPPPLWAHSQACQLGFFCAQLLASRDLFFFSTFAPTPTFEALLRLLQVQIDSLATDALTRPTRHTRFRVKMPPKMSSKGPRPSRGGAAAAAGRGGRASSRRAPRWMGAGSPGYPVDAEGNPLVVRKRPGFGTDGVRRKFKH